MAHDRVVCRYDFNQVLEALTTKFKAGAGIDWAKLGVSCLIFLDLGKEGVSPSLISII